MWQEGGEKTASGQVIAEFDPFEPKDQMELVGQALGFTPSKVTRGWERYMAEKELVNYYELHKAKTLKNFYHAVYTEDREAIKDAQEGITQYNETVPYPEMGINAKTVREGTRRYIDSQLKNEKGVSGRKTYRLEQSVRELIQSPPRLALWARRKLVKAESAPPVTNRPGDDAEARGEFSRLQTSVGTQHSYDAAVASLVGELANRSRWLNGPGRGRPTIGTRR